MNNQRRAVYSNVAGCWMAALKKQVIGYGERTMVEIVEAYVNPDLPPEDGSWPLVGKVKEFIYLLRTSPRSGAGPWHGGTQDLPAGATANAYDLKEGQIEQQRPGLMREAERFFILQQIDTLWREHLQAMDAFANQSACAATARRISD